MKVYRDTKNVSKKILEVTGNLGVESQNIIHDHCPFTLSDYGNKGIKSKLFFFDQCNTF